jgi:hypothetical protein
MSFPFDPQQGLIIVPAELWGPNGSAVLRLALDTGATGTMVNTGMLVALGYDPALIPDRVQITTGSGVEFVPESYSIESWLWDGSLPGFRYWRTPCHRAPALMVFSGLTSFVDGT